MTRPASALFCAALLGASVSLAPDLSAQGEVFRLHDMRGLLTVPPGIQSRFDEPGVLALPTGWAVPSEDGGMTGFQDDSGAFSVQKVEMPRLRAADIAGLLAPALGGAELVESGVEGRFGLVASPVTHAAVRERMAALEAMVRQEFVVEILAVDGDGPALLDADAVRAARATGTVLSERTLLADIPDLVADGRLVAFVRDFDVEVAQKSKSGDPKIDHVFAGMRLGIVVTPMADGRLYVRLGLSRSNLAEPILARRLSPDVMGVLQLPEVSIDEVRTAGVIAEGGGIVLGSGFGGGGDGSSDQGLGGGRRALVTLTRRATASEMPPEAVPLGSMAIPALPVDRARDPAVRVGEDPMYGSSRRDERGPDPLTVLDAATGGALSNRESPVSMVGTYMLLEDAALRRKVLDVARAEAEALRTWTVTWAWGTVGAQQWAAVSRTGPELAKVAASLKHRAVLPAIESQPFQMASGRERSFVRDYEVEIAQSAEAGNPVIGRAFDGLSATGTVTTMARGEPHLSAAFTWSHVKPTQPIQLGNSTFGDLDLPWTSLASSSVSQRMTPSRWAVVATHPDPDRRGDVVVVLAKVE